MPRLLLLLLFALPGIARDAWAAPVMPPPDPGAQCRAAIAAAERNFGIPAGLMAAIGQVESGRRGPDGRVAPWPWSIDAEGTGQALETKAAAIAAVRALEARGVRSIDVGCMQVNLLHHPDAFAGLDGAFDPVANVGYAARFLLRLYAQAGTWPEAAALYHSATPALGADYQRKVMAAWPGARAEGGGATQPELLPGMLPGPAVGGVHPGGRPAGGVLRRLAAPPALAADARGRGLSAYRAMPVRVAGPAFAPPRRRG